MDELSDKVQLSTFPSNKIDALTMLYLEKQELSGISPEEFVDRYIEIREKINNHFKETRKASAIKFF